MKKLMRRFIAFGLASIMVLGLTPFNLFAADSNVQVDPSRTTTSFNASSQVANLGYGVTLSAANDLQVRVFPVTNGQCTWSNLATLIATPERSSLKPVGNYVTYWNGTYDSTSVAGVSGQPVAVGDYCFVVSWSNAASGSNNYRESRVTVTQAGTGNTNGIISASATTTLFDPTSNDASRNHVKISYTVNQDLPNGYSLRIYDPNNSSVRELVSTNEFTGAGTRATVSWNGQYPNQSLVPSGVTYTYQFRVPGQGVVASGSITVAYASGGSNSADVTHSVYPSVIDPTASPTQSARIDVNVVRYISNGIMVVIRDSNGGTIRQLFSQTPINQGYYPQTWDGRDSNGCLVAPYRTYRYVILSASLGTELGSGPIDVRYSGSTACVPQGSGFISSDSAYPTGFNPQNGEHTTISYRLRRNVSNFRLTIRAEFNSNLVGTLVPDTYRYADTNYSVTWNGSIYDRSTNQIITAPAGNYIVYMFEAANEASVRGSTVIAITGSNNYNGPVITDLGQDPDPFDPNIGTSFLYQLDQDARVDLTILNGNTTVHRLLTGTSSFSNNGFGRGFNNYTNRVFWNGLDDNGYRVANNTVYTYTIAARNSSGQDGAPVTGKVTAGLVVVDPCFDPSSSMCYRNMNISNVYADPNPFNGASQSTSLKFTLNRNAYVTITVTGPNSSYGAQVVNKNLTSNTLYNAGANSISWAGTDQNGTPAPVGTYTFKVRAVSTQNSNDVDEETSTVTLTRDGTGGMQVTNVNANPSTFSPAFQTTSISFTLNTGAYTTVTIQRLSDNSSIKTLTSGSQLFGAGTNSVPWDGTDQYGSRVSNGSYKATVTATSSTYGTTSASTVVVVQSGRSSNLQIFDSPATPNPYNPYAKDKLKINFSTNFEPSTVSVRMYRVSDNAFIRELSVISRAVNTYRATWDGRDEDDEIVETNSYLYVIAARTDEGQRVERSGTVTVISEQARVDAKNRCAGFIDVSKNDPMCDAVKFVRSRGIFTGYQPDGSLRMDRVIQRAELLAVLQRSFGYGVDPYSPSADGNMGYTDLRNSTHEWYMPLVKTFTRLKIVEGYPDGRMRPEKTMNTAELYKVFFKSAKMAPGNIDQFSMDNDEYTAYAPFLDTPKRWDTRWYLKYAGLAKYYGLLTGEYFYPADGITRGQVIKLIYDTYQKGLITYPNSVAYSNTMMAYSGATATY